MMLRYTIQKLFKTRPIYFFLFAGICLFASVIKMNGTPKASPISDQMLEGVLNWNKSTDIHKPDTDIKLYS